MAASISQRFDLDHHDSNQISVVSLSIGRNFDRRLILVTTGDSDDPQEVLRQGTSWGAPTIIAGWLLLACIYYSQHRESIRHTALFKVAETLNDMRLAQIETTKMRPRSLETLVALLPATATAAAPAAALADANAVEAEPAPLPLRRLLRDPGKRRRCHSR